MQTKLIIKQHIELCLFDREKDHAHNGVVSVKTSKIFAVQHALFYGAREIACNSSHSGIIVNTPVVAG